MADPIPGSTLHVGDCLEVMRGMAENSVDAIVTDPPYGLSFMGKRWDCDVPSIDIWAECLRVLKPGGHLLAFAGTRTQHRMAVRIEDAGFEIRDMIAWVYGSGFPKSHNGEWGGTALKPALEPITVARKPLAGTVGANWRQHGTGGLNIDGCRIETADKLGGGDQSSATKIGPDGWNRPWMQDEQSKAAHAARCTANVAKAEALGRWPANLIHDGSEEVRAAFPHASGQKANTSSAESPRLTNVYSGGQLKRCGEPSADSANQGDVGFKMKPGARRADSGSAARFFYCAKATRDDRNDGLDFGSEPAVTAGATMRDRETANWSARNGNHHPTVKPTDLMRYLCRLVTPAGGLVLDPFMGSGSTGKAAVLEGFQFIGIELDPAYASIAEARIRVAQPGLPLWDAA
ncbi:TPA: site-specific DNA-methyltransferase [Stenotrophomonas maltophilia]